jgi:NADH-quinone oxidoreductase subunit H
MHLINSMLAWLGHTWIGVHPYYFVALLMPIVIPVAIFQILPLLVMIERRGAAFLQDRVGPNRAALYIQGNIAGIFDGRHGGFRIRGFGIPYTMTDLVKLVFKENFVPPFVFKSFFWVAPAIPVITGLLTPALIPWFAPIPFTDGSTGAVGWLHGTIITTSMGLLLLFAFSSLTVYGIVFGSWSSNSKYSLLGGMRASAMMISYEVSMGLSVLGMLLIVGSFNLSEIVSWQSQHTWGIFVQPVGAALFLVSLFAECNRNPFDVAEGESELIAGFHTEFAGMKFMMFMTGEYLHVIAASALFTTIYLGGYSILPAFGWDDVFMKKHLGVYAAVIIGSLAFILLVAAVLVRGRREHYAKLDASDRDLRLKEYALYIGLFASAGFALVALALYFGFEFTTTAIGLANDGARDVPTYSGPINFLAALLQSLIVLGKTIFISCIFVWVRWTLPRFRYDQIMALGWKVMLNIALINLLITAIVVKTVQLW